MNTTHDKPAMKSAMPAPSGSAPPVAAPIVAAHTPAPAKTPAAPASNGTQAPAHAVASSGNSHSKGAAAPAKDAPAEKSWSHLATAAGDGKNTIPKKR